MSKTDTLIKTKNGFQDQLALNKGQKYCRMLQVSILQYFRCTLNSDQWSVYRISSCYNVYKNVRDTSRRTAAENTHTLKPVHLLHRFNILRNCHDCNKQNRTIKPILSCHSKGIPKIGTSMATYAENTQNLKPVHLHAKKNYNVSNAYKEVYFLNMLSVQSSKYSKTCLKRPLKNRQNKGPEDR